jgi:hypothetical protein
MNTLKLCIGIFLRVMEFLKDHARSHKSNTKSFLLFDENETKQMLNLMIYSLIIFSDVTGVENCEYLIFLIIVYL